MRPAKEIAEGTQTQRTYARLAGALLLGAILIALCGGTVLSHIAGGQNLRRNCSQDCRI